MSDQFGFNGTELFVTHRTIGPDLANLAEFGFLSPAPVDWFVIDGSLIDGPLTYTVSIDDTRLHYSMLGLQLPFVVNIDAFTDWRGTLPPILGASVINSPVPIILGTSENQVSVSYLGVVGSFEFDVQVSFTDPVASGGSFIVPVNQRTAL